MLGILVLRHGFSVAKVRKTNRNPVANKVLDCICNLVAEKIATRKKDYFARLNKQVKRRPTLI